MFATSLEQGVIKYADSPLLSAIIFGRIIIIDEADKAPEHVVAIFRSLAGHGELTLPDGRRVRSVRQHDEDIAVHPNFRLILLANRPGYRMRLWFSVLLPQVFSNFTCSFPGQSLPSSPWRTFCMSFRVESRPRIRAKAALTTRSRT